ncbi:hypothetical protein [Paraburkholderia caffeinilytica]|uniref:hypothetical protein n=1 Tax=Paraburkholderia caffeinilytica TaxID=1761016 RepID=UPI003DA010E7
METRDFFIRLDWMKEFANGTDPKLHELEQLIASGYWTRSIDRLKQFYDNA